MILVASRLTRVRLTGGTWVMVLVTCSSRGGVAGREAIHMEITAPGPRSGKNCEKGRGYSNTAGLDLPCCIMLFPSSGCFWTPLSFLWCACPKLGTSHRCFIAKHSSWISSLFTWPFKVTSSLPSPNNKCKQWN